MNKMWELEVGEVKLQFEQQYSEDPSYLFSCIARNGKHFLACNVFEDEIVLNQIGGHVTTEAEETSLHTIFELFATLITTINSTKTTFKQKLAEEQKDHKNARKTFGDKY